MSVAVVNAAAEVERFTSAVFAPDDLVELRFIMPGDERQRARSEWFRAADLSGDQTIAQVAMMNRAGWGVYVGGNPRSGKGRKTADVALARCLFADFDAITLDAVHHRLDDAGLPVPTLTVASGGGFHVYWRLDEAITDLAVWSSLQRGVIDAVGSDPVVKDAPRVMRLPGFVNTKPDRGATLCHIIGCDPDRVYSVEEFAEPSIPTEAAGPVTDNGEVGDNGIIPEGRRNSTLTSIAGGLRAKGLDESEILAVLKQHNRERCQPPLPDTEVERIAQSVARYAPTLVLNPADPMPSATLFVKARYLKEDVRALHHQGGEFFAWSGACYPPADDAAVRSEVYRFLEPAKRLSGEKVVPFQPTKAKVENVLDAIRAVCNLPRNVAAPAWIEPADGPPPLEIIACRNGLLHLPSCKLHPPSPAFFTHNAIAYRYEPKAAKPKRWSRFLSQLWPDDPQSIEVLQDVFGYLLTPDTRQHKLFLIVGPKRSGKGTIGRVLAQLIGRENVCGPTLSSLTGNFGLWPLIGKLLAIISDARLSGRADQTVIAERLLSISGEDGITADRKHLQPWTGTLPTRFLILTNELPRIADASGALASRFIVLMLHESWYGRENPNLTAELLTELPGILNWAIVGWKRLDRRGHFEQPRSSADAIQQLEDLGSPVAAFVRDRCEVGPELSIACDDLFAAWKSWCTEQGRDHPGTEASFGRDLRAAITHITTRQRRSLGQRIRVYEGINLAL